MSYENLPKSDSLEDAFNRYAAAIQIHDLAVKHGLAPEGALKALKDARQTYHSLCLREATSGVNFKAGFEVEQLEDSNAPPSSSPKSISFLKRGEINLGKVPSVYAGTFMEVAARAFALGRASMLTPEEAEQQDSHYAQATVLQKVKDIFYKENQDLFSPSDTVLVLARSLCNHYRSSQPAVDPQSAKNQGQG